MYHLGIHVWDIRPEELVYIGNHQRNVSIVFLFPYTYITSDEETKKKLINRTYPPCPGNNHSRHELHNRNPIHETLHPKPLHKNLPRQAHLPLHMLRDDDIQRNLSRDIFLPLRFELQPGCEGLESGWVGG